MSDTVSGPPIFDGHNDVLTRLWKKSPEKAHKLFVDGDGEGHLDLPRIQQGGMGGGFFAMWIPGEQELDANYKACLLYTSPSPRDGLLSRMPSSA